MASQVLKQPICYNCLHLLNTISYMEETKDHTYFCSRCKNVKELPHPRFHAMLPIISAITAGTSVYNFVAPMLVHIPAAWAVAPFLLAAYIYLSMRATLVIANDRR